MDWSDAVQFVAPAGTATLAFLMGWDQYVRKQIASASSAPPDTGKPEHDPRMGAVLGKIRAMEASLSSATQQIHDLHRWHDQRDDEGRPLWYRTKGVERAIDRLADAVETLGSAVQDLRVEFHRGPPREGPTDHGT